MDAPHLQTGQSLSEYQGFGRELICYTGTSMFFKLIWTLAYFCVQYTPFKPHHQFSTLSDFIWYFHAFTEFSELNDPEIEKHFKWTLKMLKLGMVSSFHPHSMCETVERVTAKTGRTSCTNWTISFGVSGFRTRTHLLHGHFIVL